MLDKSDCNKTLPIVLLGRLSICLFAGMKIYLFLVVIVIAYLGMNFNGKALLVQESDLPQPKPEPIKNQTTLKPITPTIYLNSSRDSMDEIPTLFESAKNHSRKFKSALEVSKIFQRTSNCSNYFLELASVIFPSKLTSRISKFDVMSEMAYELFYFRKCNYKPRLVPKIHQL